MAAGAVLKKIHARRDYIRVAHVSHKNARPPAPELRVWCEDRIKGGDFNVSEIQKELEYLRLEVSAGRPGVSRASKPCARVFDPLLQVQDA